MTLTELQTRCAARYRDTGNIVIAAADWTSHLNEAVLRFVTEADFPTEETVTTLSFSAGDRSKAMQTGVVGIESARDDTNNAPLEPRWSWAEVLQEYPDPEVRGTPLVYLLYASSMYLFPVPDGAITVELTCRIEPTAMSAGSDTPTFVPVRYQSALVEWALYLAHTDDGNKEQAGAHLTAWNQWIDNAKRELTETREESYPAIRDTFYSTREAW